MKRKQFRLEDDHLGKRRKSHLPHLEIFKDETLLQFIAKSKRDESANRILECNRHKIIFGDMIKEKLISLGESVGSIEDVVCTIDHLFILTSKGLVYSYNRDKGIMEGIINLETEEVTSISLNKSNSSLILVYFSSNHDRERMMCKSILVRNIVECKYEVCEQILTTEELKYPSFVEIDNFHQVLLSFTANTKSFKIWDMKDYSLRFEMTGKSIEHVKLSPNGILVRLQLIEKKNEKLIPLKVVDYCSGNEIYSVKLKVKNRGRLTFLEFFENQIFFMQERRNLTVINLQKNEVVAVQKDFKIPRSFCYLHKARKIIGIQESNNMAVWSLKGYLEME